MNTPSYPTDSTPPSSSSSFPAPSSPPPADLAAEQVAEPAPSPFANQFGVRRVYLMPQPRQKARAEETSPRNAEPARPFGGMAGFGQGRGN